MARYWLWAALVGALAMPPASPPQAPHPAPRDLLGAARPLTPPEIASILDAVRRAVNGKTFRLSAAQGGPGAEIQIGPDGRPHFLRQAYAGNEVGRSQQLVHVDIVSVIDYTTIPAKSCAGAPMEGTLVIEYEHRSTSDRWTAKARARTTREFGAALFDMLAGKTPVESGELQQIGDRPARALVAPWNVAAGGMQPGKGLPRGMKQSLWIDRESLLPLRWSTAAPPPVKQGTPILQGYGLWFTYDKAIDPHPPEGVKAPTCIG